jgi:hypothetical protein
MKKLKANKIQEKEYKQHNVYVYARLCKAYQTQAPRPIILASVNTLPVRQISMGQAWAKSSGVNPVYKSYNCVHVVAVWSISVNSSHTYNYYSNNDKLPLLLYFLIYNGRATIWILCGNNCG